MMPVLSQTQIAAQIAAQLRISDPAMSVEVGTPERKITDSFAQALAEAGIDLNLLGGSLDLDTKFGIDLDNFVGLFRFGRQSGAFSTGFIQFGRSTPSPYSIVIPRGTQVQGGLTTLNADGSIDTSTSVIYQTTLAVTLQAGQINVAAPIQALLPGSDANLPPGSITEFANLGSPPLGITSVTNLVATTNGEDTESDAELKVRFRNTVFRNLSGTQDQYLALAISTQFSTKANVIGPISRYQEYMQVPGVDNSQVEPGETAGNGVAGQWTTTPSNNAFAKYIYLTVPYFLTNGAVGAEILFYRQDTDFVLNAPPLNIGDTYRESFEGDIPNPATTPNQPNITLYNVYTGPDTTVQLPRPNDVVLVEYSYLSAVSRNDVVRNITNCVDVYVNGENPTTADAIVPTPSGGVSLFNSNSTDKYYNQNYRRIGQPDTAPTVGNIFTALFWQPVIDLPLQIIVDTNTYYRGVHYWPVEDKTLLGNTVRSRNGIEWHATRRGATTGDPAVTPWQPGQSWLIGNVVLYNNVFYTALHNLTSDVVIPGSDPTNWSVIASPFTGQPITTTGATSITILGYTYDRNIIDLQAALDGSKQVTTDALAHRATKRYFSLDVAVVYRTGSSSVNVNPLIIQAISDFFDGQYFGSTIQLSDLLATIRNVNGVQNVRWSNDVVNPSDDAANTLNRITETDQYGNPRSPSVIFNTDFYLKDDELPVLPTDPITGLLSGITIRTRAQNTFNIN